ncbi:hypothetical protein SODALDRAFT_360374 [Sodiomyces alkalinus F11]|uniref:Uncharacterized protein n=1 Tax=Sodiomyces alkalinus (strain CBS 110278 / VKM F-3762 / F11) TaxID=1314773 RepID=A0A3N2PU49_SODAK|nr:hypothetical protein SODALDRAFT_360374 [Sodiomyces alkalinus F11]ROT38048.1 hypothetical protein SODALDRAFT_360374 [Sodiomyces alkalinus F11]
METGQGKKETGSIAGCSSNSPAETTKWSKGRNANVKRRIGQSATVDNNSGHEKSAFLSGWIPTAHMIGTNSPFPILHSPFPLLPLPYVGAGVACLSFVRGLASPSSRLGKLKSRGGLAGFTEGGQSTTEYAYMISQYAINDESMAATENSNKGYEEFTAWAEPSRSRKGTAPEEALTRHLYFWIEIRSLECVSEVPASIVIVPQIRRYHGKTSTRYDWGKTFRLSHPAASPALHCEPIKAPIRHPHPPPSPPAIAQLGTLTHTPLPIYTPLRRYGVVRPWYRLQNYNPETPREREVAGLGIRTLGPASPHPRQIKSWKSAPPSVRF